MNATTTAAHVHTHAGSCLASVGQVHLVRKHPARLTTAACTLCPASRTGDWTTALNWANKHDATHRQVSA